MRCTGRQFRCAPLPPVSWSLGTMTELTAIISPLAALLGVALTLYGQSFVAHRNRLSDLEKERMKLAHESAEKRLWLIRERLEKLHLLVGEIGREFSLTFLTIDREDKLKRTEYHKKYRLLCAKLEEAQMIADLLFAERIGTPYNIRWRDELLLG